MDKASILDKITKITDDGKLLEIFNDNEDFDIRYGIANLIKDDSILYEIFSNEENPIIKSAVLDRISRDVLDFDDFESIDAYEKIAYIETLDNESLLFDFAQKDGDFNVRIAAIYKIHDCDFIMKMTENHEDYDTRVVCLKKLKGMSVVDEISHENLTESRIALVNILNDEKFLKDIALNDASFDVQLAALDKLNKPDFQIDVIKNTSKPDNVMQLIDEIRQEELLIELVRSCHSDPFIVENAVNRISNTQALFDLCVKGNGIIREAVMKKLLFGNVFSDDKITERISIKNRISDIFGDDLKDGQMDCDFQLQVGSFQNVTGGDALADIARNDPDSDVRIAAVKWISNEHVLAEIALNDSDNGVRHEAICRISDEDILADIARSASYGRVRRDAVSRISDEDVLADVVRNDSDWEVRREAVRRINDSNVLAEIVRNDSDYLVRREAVSRISDEDVLVDVGRNDSSYSVRIAALEKIGDEDALADIALNDCDDDARISAVRRISDEDVLIDVCRNDPDWWVRSEAVSRIGNEDVLIDIYCNDPHESVQWNAFKGICREDILLDALRNNPDLSIRQNALKKINAVGTLKRLILENYGYFSTSSYSAFKRNHDKLIYESMGVGEYDDILDKFDESSLIDMIHRKLFSDFRVLITRRLVSCDVLADLALNDSDYQVRLETVRNQNLDDEKTFLKILQSDRNDSVRFEALKRLDDDDISRDMINDSNLMIGLYAYSRLGEDFTSNERKVSLKDIDPDFVGSIDDENTLYAIANNASPSVAEFAFSKIRDERILTDVVFYNAGFCNSAFNRISDNSLLLKIALYSKDTDIKRQAIKKIDDDELLLDAVMNNPFNDVSQHIINQIRDESLLKVIASDNSNPFNRKEAVNRIKNPDILTALGETESDEQVCIAIVRKTRDRGLLEFIGLSNPTKTVRRYVAGITDDEDLLYKFALKELHFDNRREIISRMTNEKYIVDLLKREDYYKVFDANFNITDPKMLIDLAVNSLSDSGIEYALKNIKDKSVLSDFIYSSPFVSGSPGDESVWKDFTKYTRELCMTVFLRPDFDDMNAIEGFLIENEFEYAGGNMYFLKNKIPIPSVYRIVLNCKSNSIRKFFKSRLEYSNGEFSSNRRNGDDNHEAAIAGLSALFG